MSRSTVRQQVATYLQSGYISGLNQIFTSFPKRINFQTNAQPGIPSRAALIVFIQNENESRIAIGGAHSGWKRVDFNLILQVYFQSSQNGAEKAMDDFDTLIDGIKDRLRADHNFGDITGNIVWQGAEPAITTSYGEPATSDGGVTDIYAQIQFLVTEMIQA
jgi:hypothetical protein